MWIAMVAANEPLAWFGVVDELRSEATGVIATLRSRSLRCELLTGDASPRARALGEALAFDAIHTGQSPDDKLARVQALQAEGKAVTMVGDGLNDAPVLQRSDVSIAVAGATDLARAQADFVIQRGDLTRVQDLHDCARRTRRIIQQNFAWALGYNLIGIPLAALGWIPPWAAALGMSASSLFVVMNSARLRSLNP
ncbi:MAG: HAD-IC family P-type ATPase [Pseudomonadota bacterium]